MNFLEKIQDPQNATPLTEVGTKLFLAAISMYQLNEDLKFSEPERTFVMNVILKRIETLKLPIAFSSDGFIAMEGLALGNPGKAITILIDCLNKLEGKTVTSTDLAAMYPWGFYKDELFTDYVDNYLKPHKTKWSEIY